ncbi:DUF3306 domain-containing protein [Massilia luteola]|uniref:DUF3306 domain-containing protein n=1 Tax=Massilia luteola TaxID=3081751 RepID=UPI002ACBEA52|nr:DUF3306 domain-containing protein [Massilia sp. Gc5]
MTGRIEPDEGFLRRWARRKNAARAEPAPVAASGAAAPPPAAGMAAAPPRAASVTSAPPAAAGVAAVPAAAASATGAPQAASRAVVAPAVASASAPAPLPTLDDVARLTGDSDFSAFVARGVDAAVRRTALKKLFADPHFNTMDRLDVYIDDYTKPSPVSEAMLASLAHAKQMFRRAVDAAGADDDPGADRPAVAEAPHDTDNTDNTT